MGLIENLKDALKREYGIETDKDLLDAIEKDPGLDIGIFVFRGEMEEKINAAV